MNNSNNTSSRGSRGTSNSDISQSGFLHRTLNAWGALTRALDALQPLAALLARLYVAHGIRR